MQFGLLIDTRELARFGKMEGVMKTFLLIDDNHPDFYVGRFSRENYEIKPELQKLKIGDILNITPFPGRAIQRES